MNMNIFYIRTTVIASLLLAMASGCKYDVAEPLWDSPPVASTEVTITSIDPAQEAAPGVNFITIHGTGFKGALDTTVIHLLNGDTTNIYKGVYFDNIAANIIECTPTAIKMLRPNLSGDSIRIKIVSDAALVAAKSDPYKIDPVMQRFGSFNDNFQINAIAVDKDENVYVLKGTTPFSVFKITPAGGKTIVGTATKEPSDAIIGTDGKLYYLNSIFPNTKEIHMVDLQTGIDSTWYTFAPVKNVICGDFDANGYLYTAGRKSGIQVIRPNRSRRDDGYYATDSVLSMRVFNGYVYAATRKAIYRHSITDSSKIGSPELVLDLTNTAFGPIPLKAFSFSADGSKMYIGTNSQYSILIVDATSTPISPNQVDILYKAILPPYCKQFCFGDKLYMISGNVTPAVNWIVYKVDVGTSGAPNY
ncbi:MAG: hypothetical protein NTX44_14840 [Ignavibacteriales bacterium]|nr:hypothetical protein [Ignavibacteriales bacterium]